jgi:hypothetical protein
MRAIFVAIMSLLVACGSSPQQTEVRAQSSQQSSPRNTRQQSPQQYGSIDDLLAPIALYPDQLLAQILLSASDPAKVTELDTWMQNNQHMKGTQMQNAAVKAGFDASFVALTMFPQVVSKMAMDIKWTTLLGQAFAADKTKVFDSIQRLRHKAQDVGTLKTTEQQEVTTKQTSGGQDVIVIEPANPQVVYVPQYNTQTVYTTAPTTTVVVHEDNTDEAVAAGLIGFTAGIAIGATMNNNYYYGPYGWHGGAYMYNDAWDDYYDAREDARDDWQDHREDMSENRSERAEDARENRGDRAETRSETRGNTQEQRTERQQSRAESGTQRTAQGTARTQSSTQSAAGRTGTTQARGYSDGSRTTQRTTSTTRSSDAFSGYSSGASQRSSSARGNSSRSSSRGGGGGRRR